MTPFDLMLILILVGAIAGFLVARAARVRATTGLPGPVCGACGYSVVGLESLACPECGGDLRRVGIRAPGARAAPPARWSGGVVAVAIGIAAAFAFHVAAVELLPRRIGFERKTQFTAPKSAAYSAAEVAVAGQTWSGGTLRPVARLEIVRSDGTRARGLEVDVTTGGYAHPDAGGRRVGAPAGVDARVVLAWMRHAGVDTTDPLTQREAETLATESRRGSLLRLRPPSIREHVETQSGGGSGGRDSGFGRQTHQQTSRVAVPGSFVALSGVAVAVVWFWGLVYLYRCCRAPSPTEHAREL